MTSQEMDRKEIEALLVFLANDTLEGDERRAVEAAVAADQVLQTELEALKRIRAQMQAEDAGRSPGEFGLARLMRDISAETPQVVASANVARPHIWQMATAAAVALFAIQTVWVWNKDDTITLAGGPDVVAQGPSITVAFSENATEAMIRALLLELNLTIVDGPRALGLYTLVAPDEAARDAAIARLQSETAIVDSAESGE